MKPNNIVKSLLLLLMLALSACASEEEKQERRENAYDLSGGYKVRVQDGSQLDMDIEIFNESGRHDIVAYVHRISPMSPQERSFLTQMNVNSDVVIDYFGDKLEIGKGYGSQLDGGENISDDFGESSRFSICSYEMAYTPHISIKYCLSGTARKKEKRLNGELTLHWTKSEVIEDENGEKFTQYSFEHTSLSFKSDMSMVFYKQYLGTWSGEVFLFETDLSSDLFSRILISESTSNGTYEATLSNSSNFSYKGEVYTWKASENTEDISYLRDPNYPAIQVSLSAPSGNRIVLFGQLWSLGDFTGSITHITTSGQTEVGTFRLSKN